MSVAIEGIAAAASDTVMRTTATTPAGVSDFLPQTTGIAAEASLSGFGRLITDGLQQVNRQLVAGQTALQQLALGDAQQLHQVMLRLEESRLSFQLMMQVRNRLLEAYQDVMKMPV